MIKATHNRIIASVDLNYKNKHRFDNGEEIRLRRNVDQFDKRITQPVNGIVIDAENIPMGAEVLLNHNATHGMHQLFDYQEFSGKNIASDIQYFSIPIHDVYGYRLNEDEWQPLFPYDFALRVFKPYNGSIKGIQPTLLKQKLFLTTGNFKNKCVVTNHHSDYEIIFQNKLGKEEKIIRVRTSDFELGKNQIFALDNSATEKIFNGELLIGVNEQNCKTHKQISYVRNRLQEAI